MGEICKSPKNEAQASTIEPTEKILKFLIVAEGPTRIIRLLQYALDDLAKEIKTNQPDGKGQPDPQLAKADKYLRCSDILEQPYETIKNDIRF